MRLVLVLTAFISVNGYFTSVGKRFFSSDSGIVKNTWKMSALYLPVILAFHFLNYMQSK